MSSGGTHGVVSREEWLRIADEDTARRSVHRDGDTGGSLLTAAAGLLTLAMLAFGPMWTVISLVGASNEHGPSFDRLWLLPLALTFAAAVPLALAIRREPTRARWVFAAFLMASLVIQLVTCPWL